MPISINGSGTITGINAGGLPDGVIQEADLATASVTADKIAANSVTPAKLSTGAPTWDSSSRLLVGTSTASGYSSARMIVTGAGTDATGSGNLVLQIGQANGSVTSGEQIGTITFGDTSGYSYATIEAAADLTAGSDSPGRLVFSTTADGASSPTEALRINSAQQLLLNTASTINSAGFRAYVNVSGSDGGLLINNTGSAGTPMRFCTNNGTAVGSITTSASATAYSTSSDYRIKENVVLLTGAIDRLQQIPVHRFNFIADPDKTVDGFLAHEAQEVVPECVTGEKDAVDDEGNPVYQGIDQSKLVPLLTAALQEAIGRIETLEAEVALLKGGS
jgi:hypothetical protein